MRQGWNRLYSAESLPMTFWFVLLAAMLLKFGYYGLRYFPVLDDNNMYGVFAMMTPGDALVGNRWYATRPLAGVLDAVLWSRLWGHQSLILVVMILLHFSAIVLLWAVFRRNNLRVGMVAAVLFALLPLGTEATYWTAASSRLVVALFWASLSLYLLACYLEKVERKQPRAGVSRLHHRGQSPAALCLGGFWLTNLISLGFYEQVIAFSFAGALLMLLAHAGKLRRREGRWAFLVPVLLLFFNVAAIGVWYKAFSHLGSVAARGQLVTGDYLGHAARVLQGMRTLLGPYQWQMLKRATCSGLQLVLADRAYPYLVLILAASSLLTVLATREAYARAGRLPRVVGSGAAGAGIDGKGIEGKAIEGRVIGAAPARAETAGARRASGLWPPTARFALGALLVVVPFAPFFLLKNAWIYNRNGFLSLLGLALMVDALIDGATRVARRETVLAPLRGALLGALAFSLLFANTAELADYRRVSLTDREICRRFIAAVETADHNWYAREILLFNARPLYANLTTDHLTNCTASDWALMGALQVARGDWRVGPIHPVPEGSQFTLSQEKLRSALYLGIDDGMAVFPLSGRWIDTWCGAILELRKADGHLFGRVTPAAGAADQFRFSLTKP